METPNPSEQKPEPVVYNEETAILKENIMVALINTGNGPGILLNLKTRESIVMAKGEIDARLTFTLVKGDMQAEAMRSGKIVKPGGIMGFVKGGKRF